MRRSAATQSLEDKGIPASLGLALRELLRVLIKQDPKTRLYLCGSYARGDWLKDSDVDLIVVSKMFSDLHPGLKFALVKKHMAPGFPLDVQAFTPKEFERAKKRSVILRDMLSYALEVSFD